MGVLMSGIEGGGYGQYLLQRKKTRKDIIDSFNTAGADLSGFRTSTWGGLTRIEQGQVLNLKLKKTATGSNSEILDFYILLSEARIAARFSVDILRHLKDKGLASESDLNLSLETLGKLRGYNGGQILSTFNKNKEGKEQLEKNLLEIIQNTDELLRKNIEVIKKRKNVTLESAVGDHHIQEDGEGTPGTKRMLNILGGMKAKLPATPDLRGGMRGVKQKASTMTNPFEDKLRALKERQLERAKTGAEAAIKNAGEALEKISLNEDDKNDLKEQLDEAKFLIKPTDVDDSKSKKIAFVRAKNIANDVIKKLSALKQTAEEANSPNLQQKTVRGQFKKLTGFSPQVPNILPKPSAAKEARTALNDATKYFEDVSKSTGALTTVSKENYDAELKRINKLIGDKKFADVITQSKNLIKELEKDRAANTCKIAEELLAKNSDIVGKEKSDELSKKLKNAAIEIAAGNFSIAQQTAAQVYNEIHKLMRENTEQASQTYKITIQEASEPKPSLLSSLRSNLPGALPSISNAAKGLYNRIPPLPGFIRKTPKSLDDTSSPSPSEPEIDAVIDQAKAPEPAEISIYDVQKEYGEWLLSIAQLKETVGASEKEAADMELAFALGALEKIKEDNLHEGLNNFNPLLEEASSLLKKEDATKNDVEHAKTLTMFVVYNLIALSKVEAVNKYHDIVNENYLIDPGKNDEINRDVTHCAEILSGIESIENIENFEDFQRKVGSVVTVSDGILLRLKELENSAEPIVAETASREESSDAVEETPPPSSMASIGIIEGGPEVVAGFDNLKTEFEKTIGNLDQKPLSVLAEEKVRAENLLKFAKKALGQILANPKALKKKSKQELNTKLENATKLLGKKDANADDFKSAALLAGQVIFYMMTLPQWNPSQNNLSELSTEPKVKRRNPLADAYRTLPSNPFKNIASFAINRGAKKETVPDIKLDASGNENLSGKVGEARKRQEQAYKNALKTQGILIEGNFPLTFEDIKLVDRDEKISYANALSAIALASEVSQKFKEKFPGNEDIYSNTLEVEKQKLSTIITELKTPRDVIEVINPFNDETLAKSLDEIVGSVDRVTLDFINKIDELQKQQQKISPQIHRGVAPFLNRLIRRGTKVKSFSPEQKETTPPQEISIAPAPAAAVNDELRDLRAKRAELSVKLEQANAKLKHASEQLQNFFGEEEKSDEETEESLNRAVEKAKSEVGDLNELLQQTTEKLQKIEPKPLAHETVAPLPDDLKSMTNVVKELLNTESTFLNGLIKMRDMLVEKKDGKSVIFATTLGDEKRNELIGFINTYVDFVRPVVNAELSNPTIFKDWGAVKELFDKLDSLFSNPDFEKNITKLFVSSSNTMTLQKNDKERSYAYRNVAITPTQRVPRYVLLFKEVAKHIKEAKEKEGGNVDLAAVEDLNSKILSKCEGIAKKFNRLQANNDLKEYLNEHKNNDAEKTTYEGMLLTVIEKHLKADSENFAFGDESIKKIKQVDVENATLKKGFSDMEQLLQQKIAVIDTRLKKNKFFINKGKLLLKRERIVEDLKRTEEYIKNINNERCFIDDIMSFHKSEIENYDKNQALAGSAAMPVEQLGVVRPRRDSFLYQEKNYQRKNLLNPKTVTLPESPQSAATFDIINSAVPAANVTVSSTSSKTPVQILQDICSENFLIKKNRDQANTNGYYLLDSTNVNRVDIKVKDKDNSTNDTTALSLENKTDSNKMAAVTYDTRYALLAINMALNTASQMQEKNGKTYQITEPAVSNLDEARDYLTAVRNFCLAKSSVASAGFNDVPEENLIAALKKFDIGIVNPRLEFKSKITEYLDSSGDDSSEQKFKKAFKAYLTDPTSPKKGNQGMLADAPKSILRRH